MALDRVERRPVEERTSFFIEFYHGHSMSTLVYQVGGRKEKLLDPFNFLASTIIIPIAC